MANELSKKQIITNLEALPKYCNKKRLSKRIQTLLKMKWKFAKVLVFSDEYKSVNFFFTEKDNYSPDDDKDGNSFYSSEGIIIFTENGIIRETKRHIPENSEVEVLY